MLSKVVQFSYEKNNNWNHDLVIKYIFIYKYILKIIILNLQVNTYMILEIWHVFGTK